MNEINTNKTSKGLSKSSIQNLFKNIEDTQKALSIFDKYDTDKSQILDENEQANISEDDKKLFKNMGIELDKTTPKAQSSSILGSVNPEDYINFNKRKLQDLHGVAIGKSGINYTEWEQKDSRIRITTSDESEQPKKSSYSKTITDPKTNRIKSINTTTKFDTGDFIVENTTVEGTGKRGKEAHYYLKTGQEITEKDFYKKIYNVQSSFKNDKSQVIYNENGINYTGNIYSITGTDNQITVTNKSNNKTTHIDLDFLLRDINSTEIKENLIGVIQQLPGEALEDLSKEITQIELKPDLDEEELGEFNNDGIYLNPGNKSINNQKELKRAILHEIGHSIEDTPAGDELYEKGVTASFNKELSTFNQKVGASYDDVGLSRYSALIKEKINNTAESGYGAKDENENFAERYTQIMNGSSDSQAIFNYFPKTGATQLKQIQKVRTQSRSKRMDTDANYRLDRVLYKIRDNSFKIEQDKNNPQSYILTVFQKNTNKPQKVIKFNTDENISSYKKLEDLIVNVGGTTLDEMTEFSLTDDNVAFQTNVDKTSKKATIQKFNI